MFPTIHVINDEYIRIFFIMDQWILLGGGLVGEIITTMTYKIYCT